jgi:hypothetical protein
MRSVRVAVAGAALVGLGACQTVSQSDFTRVEDEVSALRARVEAAETRAAQAEAAAAQCNETCALASERADRMFEQSMRK